MLQPKLLAAPPPPPNTVKVPPRKKTFLNLERLLQYNFFLMTPVCHFFYMAVQPFCFQLIRPKS